MCIAIPGKIESISGEGVARAGVVDFGGIRREINLSCTPETRVGDWILAHAGLAIGLIDEESARQIFDDLEQIYSPSTNASDAE
jgi:hydrogenase expression/formation protein HypC